MAGLQAVSFQSAIMKWLMNCGIQHTVSYPANCFLLQQKLLTAQETCNTGIDHFDRRTHWLYCVSEYLRRLKWATCQHFTSLQATGQGRETLLVSCEWLIEWLIGGVDLNQHFHCPSPDIATEETVLVIYLQGVCPSFDFTSSPQTSQEKDTNSSFYSSRWLVKGPYHCFGHFPAYHIQ